MVQFTWYIASNHMRDPGSHVHCDEAVHVKDLVSTVIGCTWSRLGYAGLQCYLTAIVLVAYVICSGSTFQTWSFIATMIEALNPARPYHSDHFDEWRKACSPSFHLIQFRLYNCHLKWCSSEYILHGKAHEISHKKQIHALQVSVHGNIWELNTWNMPLETNTCLTCVFTWQHMGIKHLKNPTRKKKWFTGVCTWQHLGLKHMKQIHALQVSVHGNIWELNTWNMPKETNTCFTGVCTWQHLVIKHMKYAIWNKYMPYTFLCMATFGIETHEIPHRKQIMVYRFLYMVTYGNETQEISIRKQIHDLQVSVHINIWEYKLTCWDTPLKE